MMYTSAMKKRILFICTHNSARSQMAEGLPHESTKGFFAQPLEMVREGNEAEQHLISNRIRRVCHDSTREVS
jgi:hypothetical protein